ncbi:hypothetical protein [uncultured Methanosphaera sp.]|uniref:hypothetical protein n=1 Tax=uncultured Methanosphaera sp. TaxID=262501 RepID=UPI000DC26A42|nr:hypothetical protein [uncultured Methanosphaera sp.]RAP44643.1 MAG: hypothetical protein BZ134_03000 [Methanosphaera sp. SHI1033]
MSYIVCPNCKRFVKVNDSAPLAFDKCENCGHVLEFAADEQELQFILRGIELPKISYYKICSNCKSVNPRETGTCLYCGGTRFQLQYDMDSVNKYNQSIRNMAGVSSTDSQQNNTHQFSYTSQGDIHTNWLFRVVAMILGVIDFFFFALVGLGFIVDESNLPSSTAEIMTFVSQNMESLMIILVGSLLIAGILAVFILPRMSYKDSFTTSSTIGLIIGIITITVSRDVLVILSSIVVCGIITGIGGVIGEFIVQKLTKMIRSG